MRKAMMFSLIVILLLPTGVFAQSSYNNLYGATGITPSKDQADTLKVAVELILLYKLLGQPTVVSSNGEIIVLFGNKISKYDKDLNLVKEVNLTLDVTSMKELVSKVAENYSKELAASKAGSMMSSVKSDISTNDSLAKSTLRAISTAAESYATANSGNYPNSIRDLTEASKPYLKLNKCDKEILGYSYSCTFNAKEYKIIATPVVIGETGTTTYTITTGGVLRP